ncbi:MSHA biogenesis protein MshF2 [Aeromonas hydrophila]|nr:MSHA biogenesis protein MshF2 [Aeromonas hydrophila]
MGSYRRLAVGILLLIMVATLARSYLVHREEALAVSLSLLGEQFAERAQRLHGLWLDQRRPAVLHADGIAWQFDERGWPLGAGTVITPSENCRWLWEQLIGTAASTQPPVQALASLDGEGCEFGWENNWLIYQFSDGRVRQKP